MKTIMSHKPLSERTGGPKKYDPSYRFRHYGEKALRPHLTYVGKYYGATDEEIEEELQAILDQGKFSSALECYSEVETTLKKIEKRSKINAMS